MPESLALLLTPLAVVVSILGPGLWAVRRAPWTASEKALAALVLSILVVGLASFGLCVADLHPLLRPLLAAACAALLLTQTPALLRAVERPEARRDLSAFLALLLWLTALQAVARVFSYGDAYADWVEHYQRSWFFLGNQPSTKRFIGYLLPARPPLLNAFAAQVLAITGGRFAVYQWTALALAALAYFPALQLARLWSASRRLPWILATLLGLSPMFVHNATYTWTKMQAVFFLLAALAFYVAGWRQRDPARLVFAFVCAAAGLLLHYSIAPAVAFLAGHYLLVVLPHSPRPARDLALVAGVAAIILAPWFVWSVAVFGVHDTVSTAAASTGPALPGVWDNTIKIALNLRDTVVPHLLRGVPSDRRLTGLGWGSLRDTMYALYIRNLVLAFGAAGAFLLGREAWGAARRPVRPAAGTPCPDGATFADAAPRADGPAFWIGLALFNVVVGLAVYGGRDPLGLAYSAQQPIVVIALAFLAARFETWPRGVRLVAAVAALCDAALGILLNAWMQMFLPDVGPDWKGPLGLTQADLALGRGEGNLMLKEMGRHRFIADIVPWVGWIAWPVAALLFLAAARLLLRLARRPAPADQSSPRISDSSVPAST